MSTALAFSLLSAVSALSPVTIRGNAFYNGSDSRFYIKGVDYQPGGSSNVTDPLADPNVCKRDIEHFTDLGINTIRVYTVDNSANHDECMQLLEDAGIYLLLDVNTPKQSLNRENNETLAVSYNSGYLQHIFATIDAFKSYPNTLGFFAANEVINDINSTVAAPYIKAVVRDMKAYIKEQANRTIPVGYSAADIAENRWQQMQYLNCGNDEGERIDMFGMNDYSWCGPASNFEISGWSQNMQTYSNYSIPLFMSEYGCNKVTPRTFPEISTLYSSEMSSLYSGGLVYEYSKEENNYGLVSIDGDQVSELPDYSNFKNALANIQLPQGNGDAKDTSSPSQCPAFDEQLWEVDPSAPLPQMPRVAQSYLKNGAGTPLGLDGPDTQAGSELDLQNSTISSNISSSATHSSSAHSSTARSSSGHSSSVSLTSIRATSITRSSSALNTDAAPLKGSNSSSSAVATSSSNASGSSSGSASSTASASSSTKAKKNAASSVAPAALPVALALAAAALI